MRSDFEKEHFGGLRNIDAGIGRNIITKSISEMRGRNGVRIYYRMKGEMMEIIGYSSKNNQQDVINRLIKIYGK
ncbi:hypothetical protein C4F50_16285 [Flavobacterium sp. KB82]|uniref:Uncharacterized protein n=1 Tax=Flavobacterium hungaricum TaxID=2082725 RepID=A0ABR9TMA4_9FLAO|nr:hypothetical protein [Flavobacterium hungaricum]